MEVDDLKAKASRAGDPSMMADGEPTSKAMAIGAAAGAGLLGVQLTGDLTTSAVLAIVCAYGTTLDNTFGSATKSLGSACSKVYDKTLDLQEEYELIQKAKSAIDTTLTVADNLNTNYEITGKIDEKLKISAAVDNVPPIADPWGRNPRGRSEIIMALTNRDMLNCLLDVDPFRFRCLRRSTTSRTRRPRRSCWSAMWRVFRSVSLKFRARDRGSSLAGAD